MREALGDAPIVTLYRAVLQQVFGWPMYLIRNAAGQLHYPAGTNRKSTLTSIVIFIFWFSRHAN